MHFYSSLQVADTYPSCHAARDRARFIIRLLASPKCLQHVSPLLSVFHKLNAAMKASAYRSIFLSSVPFFNNTLPPLQTSNSYSVVSLTREKIQRLPVIQTHTSVRTLHFLEGSVQLCKGPQLSYCLYSRLNKFIIVIVGKKTFETFSVW